MSKMYESLVLPLDKNHFIRQSFAGWEYVVRENKDFRKSYDIYANEIDVTTYCFEGYNAPYPELQGGVIITFYDDSQRKTRSYDMKGKMFREEDISTDLVFENLKRHAKPGIVKQLIDKKSKATPVKRLQQVILSVDKDHKLTQTLPGLWRYQSVLSGKTYVFYRTEISTTDHDVSITLFDRNVVVYDGSEKTVQKSEDVLKYLITREKEKHFADSVICNINANMVVNRRGWGRYIHFLDDNMVLHAFALGKTDETPDNIPHVLDMMHASQTLMQVILHEDVYEDYVVNMSTGEYKPTGIFRTSLDLSKQRPPFKNQKQKLENYLKQDTRRIASRL